MKFIDESFKQLLRNVYGLSESSSEEEIASAFLTQKSEYIDNIKSWKRAQRQRQNWQKYRTLYQIGINRFHRNGKDYNPDGLVDRAKKQFGLKEGATTLSVVPLLRDLTVLEQEIYRQFELVDMEESFVEGQLFLERAAEIVVEAKKFVLEGKTITEEHLQMLEILCTQP